jgi:putative transposase
VAAAAGAKILRTPYRTARANAHLERLLGSVLREALDRLIILNERHLLAVLREYLDHYNHARPHRSLELRLPIPVSTSAGSIVRRQRLHGLINEYSRAA